MPFYKCFGCMKSFMSETRATQCKFCEKLLNEDVNRQSAPPRLVRSNSAPQLGAMTPQQQVVHFEVSQKQVAFKLECPRVVCRSNDVACLGADPIFASGANLYVCNACTVNFVWNPLLPFEKGFASQDVTYRMTPLNVFAFRGLNLPGPLDCLNVFKKGFPVRRLGYADDSPWNIQYRTSAAKGVTLDEEEFPMAGDIFPESAHCFATRIPGATIFPNDATVTRTYVFVCFLREGFDTRRQQRREVALIQKYYPFLSAASLRKVAWPLEAYEVAVEELDSSLILASIRCDKVWASGNWKDGGTYRLYLPSLMFNPSTPLAMHGPITAMLKRHRAGTIPSTPL
ncbi:hypothetical protein ACN47A_40780 [Myxococcus fulvus]|uniref:hypothetical protein n=1 Tax=Myxococcus fulvus TaxID=33 RepID=UPI003B9D2392